MKLQKSKGFTLIELLVVIAIIGILASIVLVSFPGATKKAKDTRIISAIGQARTVMTYVNANDGSYDAFGCTLGDMTTLCTEIANNHPTKGTEPTIVHNAASNSSAACIYSLLNAKSDYWYCADSTGLAGFIDSSGADPAPGDATYCVDNATAVCPPAI